MKALYLSILLLLTSVLFAQKAGTLDKSYGTNNNGTVSIYNEVYTQSLTIQPDDKVVFGGYDSTRGQDDKFMLTRRNKNGSLDTAFGIEGQVTTMVNDLQENVEGSLGWTGIAIQKDGKIISVGGVNYYNPDYPENYFQDIDIVLVRFLPDGTPDESFGSHGRVITNLGYLEYIYAIAIQPDGKIVVSGSSIEDIDFNTNGILVARYNTDGTLDKSFGEYNGYTIFDEVRGTYGSALLLQPDGKIVAGGTQISNESFFIVRYLPNGKIDSSFGKNGVAETVFKTLGGITQLASIALDTKGRIVATGTVGADEGAAVTRYLPDGQPDNSFDTDGKLELYFKGFNYTYPNTVLAQPGGKLIISSLTAGNNDTSLSILLTGLTENGSIDTSFGTDNGMSETDIGITDIAAVKAAMQTDGKIIVSSNQTYVKSSILTNTHFLTRFFGYPVPVSLVVRIKRWLQNHTLTWKGLPADDKIAYYSVEQSPNSNKGFVQVAKVSGAANLKEYAITNSHLLDGMNYYRIKAVSTDGAIRYSEVASADNTANTASVFPNPAQSYVTVQGLKTNETANISIKNANGNVMVQGVSSGGTQYRSSVSNLQPGTYYLDITTKDKTETLKFVKE